MSRLSDHRSIGNLAISVARNLAIARTSEMSEKVPESSISLAEISGGVKSKI